MSRHKAHADRVKNIGGEYRAYPSPPVSGYAWSWIGRALTRNSADTLDEVSHGIAQEVGSVFRPAGRYRGIVYISAGMYGLEPASPRRQPLRVLKDPEETIERFAKPNPGYLEPTALALAGFGYENGVLRANLVDQLIAVTAVGRIMQEQVKFRNRYDPSYQAGKFPQGRHIYPVVLGTIACDNDCLPQVEAYVGRLTPAVPSIGLRSVTCTLIGDPPPITYPQPY